jgi:hypothetical protein
LETVSPTHPSGASPHDLEVFHWVGTEGARLRDGLNNDCGTRVNDCAYADPNTRVACFARIFPACDRALQAVDRATIPPEVAPGLVGFRDSYANSRCVYEVGAEALARDPSLGRRLTRRPDGTFDSMETLIFRDDERGRVWARPFAERLTACPAGSGQDLSVVTAWLQERFSCGRPHPRVPGITLPGPCDVEIVGLMVAAGVDPGPPRRP